MSRGLSVKALRVEDHVRAALREAGSFPMSTLELTEGLGPYAETHHRIHSYGPHGCPKCECKVEKALPEGWWRTDVYRSLRRLARRGVVEKVTFTGQREVYWRLSGA